MLLSNDESLDVCKSTDVIDLGFNDVYLCSKRSFGKLLFVLDQLVCLAGSMACRQTRDNSFCDELIKVQQPKNGAFTA